MAHLLGLSRFLDTLCNRLEPEVGAQIDDGADERLTFGVTGAARPAR